MTGDDGRRVPAAERLRRRAGTRLLLALLSIAAAACGAQTPADSDPSGTGEHTVGTDELRLRLPDGWDLRASPADELVVLAAHPQHEWGRIGVFRVERLNDVGLYVADTTTIGAALRGLEPELLREEIVEVPGAHEAQLVESVYSAPVEGRPRLRSLQLALRRTDDLGFDVRIELPEDEWEPGTADEVIRSVRLLGAPR